VNSDPRGEPVSAAIPDEAPAPDTEALLELQRMELALVRADLECPDTIAAVQLRRLRYLLRFAHLTDFQPAAAEQARRLPDRPEVSLGAELAGLRRRVIDTMRGPLRVERDQASRLQRAGAELGALEPELADAKREVLDRHAHELRARELEAELRTKALVNVAGGGGGAGYVYIGAYQRLNEAGVRPAYVIGASIGSVMGLFAARSAVPDWSNYLTLARTLRMGELFGPPVRQRRYGLPGLVRLHLDSTFGNLFSSITGEPTRLGELEVPYEAVVAGVRRRSYDRLPARFRKPRQAGEPTLEAEAQPRRLARAWMGAAIASRMWQVAAFFDPRIVKPVVLGADERTAGLRAIDAAGFSSAIPGVLHYDLADADPVLEDLFEREELAALIDGGVTANVPASLAWRSVQRGKLGTRNVFLLGFDCFHPQWDPRHLWLQPITQAVALQRVRDVPFADWIVRFEPTLSPVTLVPGPETVDLAIGWGSASVEKVLPMIERMLEPVWWD